MKINVPKSVKYKRLVYSWDSSSIPAFLSEYFWYGMLLYALYDFIFSQRRIVNPEELCIALFFMALAATCLFYRDRAVLIKNGALPGNRKILLTTLQSLYPDMDINDYSDGQVKIFEKHMELFSAGKRMTIIYSGNDAFINAATVGRFNVKSPFRSLQHYYRLSSVEKKIRNFSLSKNW